MKKLMHRLTLLLGGLILMIVVPLLVIHYVFGQSPNPDPYADSVVSSSNMNNTANATGVPDMLFATKNGLGNSDLVLDMGLDEEGIGDLTLNVSSLTIGLNVNVTFLDASNTIIATQNQNIVSTSPVFAYNWTTYGKAYRYVEIATSAGTLELDALQAANYLCSSATQDTDGDGVSDCAEQAAGTNPLDPTSYPIDNCPGGDFSGSNHDGTCGTPPPPPPPVADTCPGGDFSGNRYDGTCGTPPPPPPSPPPVQQTVTPTPPPTQSPQPSQPPAPTPIEQPKPTNTQQKTTPPAIKHRPSLVVLLGKGELGRWIHENVPEPVARSFPWWMFLILFIMILRLLWQAYKEVVANRHMLALLKRQKLLAEEKDNFIGLSAHYLRTPLTIMAGGAENMLITKEAPRSLITPFITAINHLGERIKRVLSEIEGDKILTRIEKPAITEERRSIFRSGKFWLPILGIGGIVLLANFLFGYIGEIDLGIYNLIAQAIAFVALGVFFFLAIRNHKLKEQERHKNDQLNKYQQAIDDARSEFIDNTTAELRGGLKAIRKTKQPLGETPTMPSVNNGYERFESTLSKFELLGQLKASGEYMHKTTFSLTSAIKDTIKAFQPIIKAKKLTVDMDVDAIKVTQNPKLFMYVLHSVIDNAVKFSKEKGTIKIAANSQTAYLKVTIQDNGIGIAKDDLPHLFKPFNRATSTTQFDYEGMGFSLFLDRIIMDHLEGDITANSESGKGTRLQLLFKTPATKR